MTRASFVVKNGTLQPYTKEAAALMEKLVENDVITVRTLMPRSSAFNALVFGTIEKAAKAIGIPAEDLRARLMVLTGRCRVVDTGTKKVVVVNSMSETSMSEKELHAFWDEAKPLIERIIHYTEGADADEVRRMLAA